ncbi:MAG TPA: M20 family metallopeptidase [Lacipirellulaceae bacterium]|jgi:acetylornithine deacetylase
MSLDPVETLQQLIRIPSVNPMGRVPAGPHEGESRLTDNLQRLCDELGWPWLRQPVHPGRENLVAIITGHPPAVDGGELLLWDVHQDTVSADGMSVDPFAGELRDGRVYGRGACDVKGSMAAMLAALSRLGSPDAKETRPTIVLALTVNEECGFTGAKAISQLWRPNTIAPQDLFPRPPDAAIVAEPTDLNVVVAHQGVVRWRCHIEGRAAHSSRPDQGINAIYAAARVVQVIERYHHHLATSSREHSLCGRPSVCVGTIHGGVGINTVPERATIEIDRRIGPGEDPAIAYADFVRYVADKAEVGVARVVHDPPFMKSAGLTDERNGPLSERLVHLVRDSGRSCDRLGVPYGTDAAAIAASGVPTVVFGPGSILQAHTADEFIEMDELQRATDLLYRIAKDGLR